MICSICSDKAEGYHFGAISCAACGAFFRRSVSDQKVYSCSNRQCNIAHDPRKRGGSCRFCRFLKCVTSGMMPQDVKAKRASASQQNITSLYRNMNQSSILLIDQIILFRRNIASERHVFDSISRLATRTNLMIFLHQEFDMLRRISLGCPFFMQITENIYAAGLEHKMIDDPLNDIFLLLFVFESCFLTGTKGGVQLDRLFFPNMMYVDLSEIPFIGFLEADINGGIDPYRNIQNAFSYLVQMVSRSFQSANLEEPILSILLYKCITETVPPSYRHSFAEINRDSLLTDLNRVDETLYQQTQVISEQIHQGVRVYKEAISSFWIV
ncbi:unnamed protein product [Caenorhabditis brenneri]